MVEQWFPDADTNTVLLLLEREPDKAARVKNEMRFIRLRRPLAQFFPGPTDGGRRGGIEEFLEIIMSTKPIDDDPRMQINAIKQGLEGGLVLDVDDNGIEL